MARIERKVLLEKFRGMIAKRQPIIGGGAGTGLSAKCEEAGGIDLIVIYNSGRYRMAGRGSLAGLLAYGNANDIVQEMAREVLPVVKSTPVLAGVNGTDPFAIMDHLLDHLKSLGFSGVQNFPTVGLFDGIFRKNLEETGMGYGLEVDMIRKAHERDMLTTPYVFSVDEAVAMTKAGADMIVPHMGLTTGGSIGAEIVPRRGTPLLGTQGGGGLGVDVPPDSDPVISLGVRCVLTPCKRPQIDSGNICRVICLLSGVLVETHVRCAFAVERIDAIGRSAAHRDRRCRSRRSIGLSLMSRSSRPEFDPVTSKSICTGSNPIVEVLNSPVTCELHSRFPARAGAKGITGRRPDTAVDVERELPVRNAHGASGDSPLARVDR